MGSSACQELFFLHHLLTSVSPTCSFYGIVPGTTPECQHLSGHCSSGSAPSVLNCQTGEQKLSLHRPLSWDHSWQDWKYKWQLRHSAHIQYCRLFVNVYIAQICMHSLYAKSDLELKQTILVCYIFFLTQFYTMCPFMYYSFIGQLTSG